MATLGDLADAVNSDSTAIATDQKSINDIQASLTTAQTNLANDQAKLAHDNSMLGSALTLTGGFFRMNSDGTATVYESDGSGGVTVKILKPDTTPAP